MGKDHSRQWFLIHKLIYAKQPTKHNSLPKNFENRSKRKLLPYILKKKLTKRKLLPYIFKNILFDKFS